MFGTGGDSFSPIRHITRQELACVLYRRAGSPETWQATWQWDWQELDDGEDIAPYARMAVQWGMESYLLPHYYYSDGEHHQYYLPRGTVSRSELAELLYKLYLLNPAPYDIDLAEVDFISLHGENPTEKTRLDKPEEIERFIGLLNRVELKTACSQTAAIGCAGKGFTIFLKQEGVQDPALKERNTLRFEQPGTVQLVFSGREAPGFEVVYTLILPDTMPEDEFAEWIYGLKTGEDASGDVESSE